MIGSVLLQSRTHCRVFSMCNSSTHQVIQGSATGELKTGSCVASLAVLCGLKCLQTLLKNLQTDYKKRLSEHVCAVNNQTYS